MEFFSSVSNADNQTFFLIIFSVLLTFLLSALLVFTYEKTSRDVISHDHFIQSIILMAVVTATIMQSIGESMARGFGIFGALAILRFRTNISNPRNIAFIFAAMAVGIACGVYSFFVSVIGTISFCLIAFFLRLTPFSKKNSLIGQLRYELPTASTSANDCAKLLKNHCKEHVLKRYRLIQGSDNNDIVEYTYEIRLPDETKGIDMVRELRSLPDINNIRLGFNDTYISQYD